MASEKVRPTNISTEAANAASSRESDFHTVSPVSPLFADDGHEEPSTSTTSPPAGENPPPKPSRPLSPQQQAEMMLAEAFPTVEPSVIKAVLIASRGDIEPAFNALLAMTDPSFIPEEQPPAPAQPQPQRSRTYSPRIDSKYNPALVYQDRIDLRPHQPPTITPRNQLEADELYARQLAEHYNNAGRPRGRSGAQNVSQPRHQRNESEDDYNSEEKEHSFLDDDLPVIKENIRQGFLQTQSKVNQWVADLKKKLDLDDEPGDSEAPPTHDSRAGHSAARGVPSGYARYDADPRVLGDDFAHLELRDNSQAEVPPRRPPRPVANPNLFQSSASTGNTGGQRKVSFQDAHDDDDLYRSPSPRPLTTAATGATTKQLSPTASKWQPLTTVEPKPLDGDPFSLGDSEDEKDNGLVPEPKPGASAAGDKNSAGHAK